MTIRVLSYPRMIRLGLLLLLVVAVQSYGCDLGTQDSPSARKAVQMLHEQKARGELVNEQAVELIIQEKMSEARALYKSRWDELARIRLAVAQDEELDAHDRETVGRALKADQEGVTEILTGYEELYGND